MSTTRRPSQTPAPKKRTFASRQDAWKFWLRRLLIIGVVGTLVMVAIAFFAYQATTIPNPNTAYQAQATTVLYKGGKSEVGKFAIQNRESIPLSEVPQVMQDAMIAAEDRTFWTNKGIDPKGILRAAFSNARGNETQGASTITQQYVKILYLTQERTLKRKVKEAFLSLKVHNQQSKSQILEGYLNTIYFGRGAYGIEAAAEAYFAKPAKQLTLAESAMLASIVNSPNYLNPDRSDAAREALTRRYQSVLNAMVDMGNADPGEVEKAYGALPKLSKSNAENKYGGQRGFMMGMVKSELIRLGFSESEIEGGGLRVTTTFTRKAMRAAREAVAENRPDLKGLHVGVASVDVKTGGLIGFYGGQDYLKSQLNWANPGKRCCAPGSAFKPFALAAGLVDGFSLKDTFDGNSPYTFPNGDDVENEGERAGEADGHDYGRVNLIKATEDSINTAYTDLVMSMEDGPQKVLDTAVKMGIDRDSGGLQPYPSIVLGPSAQSPIGMANAYASIANGGVAHKWFVVKRVVRASDDVELYKAPEDTHKALDEDIASDVSYALQQVVKSGTGRNALSLGRPAAGKTGTATNGNGDVSSSWFVGYTPQVATAVMYVRGKGDEALNGFMPSYFGADYPTRTWTDTMSKVLEGVEVEDFPPPAYVDGDAPSKGHAPYTPPPPPPKPTDACKNLPGNQPKGTDCNPTPTPTPTQTQQPDFCPDAGVQGVNDPCSTDTPTPTDECPGVDDFVAPCEPDPTTTPSGQQHCTLLGGCNNNRELTTAASDPYWRSWYWY